MLNPPNPWASRDVEWLGPPPELGLELHDDLSATILAENDSPDVGFSYSVNPYRGCAHGCAYCYARPSHEWLSFGAGADFERKLVVKRRAPELLRAAFEKASWRGELVAFSGVTDCYQPVEASLRLTRGCLEVCAEYRNPVWIITKGALIERDLDVLAELRAHARVGVSISIPLWDADQARALEPYAPTPARRVKVIERLAAAGHEVCVNVAPLIPGLGDRDLTRVLTAAAAAGARRAALIYLRLPGSVRPVFEQRLRATLPLAAERVLSRQREVRGGQLNDPRFGSRMLGRGEYADTVTALFHQQAERLGLATWRGEDEPPPPTTFRRPTDRGGQLRLFG
jgi:DNA repair photolyase